MLRTQRSLLLTLACACACAAAQRLPDGGPAPAAPMASPDAATSGGAAAAPPDGARASKGPTPDLSLVSGRGTVTFEASRGEVVVRAEVVTTPEGRQQGLMYRRALAPDAGMVFVFPEEEVQSFWMRNTYVPLDIIFVNERREVVGVSADAVPLTTSPRTVGKPSRYVVEVVAGLCAATGIRAGTRVRFEGVPTSAAR